ncbi:MAG: hypothetical protein RL434_1363 [Pseudomonadota bacterium]
MHNRFQQPLILPLRPSGRTLGTLRTLHALAAGLVLLALPWIWQILPSLLLLGVSCYATERELLAAARAYRALELTTAGQWCLRGCAETREPLRLAGHPFVMGTFVILPLATGRRRYTIALDEGNTGREELRRLRVRLRLEPAMRAAVS